MRLLVDANLAPRVAEKLRDHGYQAAHVIDVGLLTASDQAIMTHAADTGHVIISADTDFGELLAASRASRPSVILLRSADRLTPDQQVALLLANLPAITEALNVGAVVTIARGRMRVRSLPILPRN